MADLLDHTDFAIAVKPSPPALQLHSKPSFFRLSGKTKCLALSLTQFIIDNSSFIIVKRDDDRGKRCILIAAQPRQHTCRLDAGKSDRLPQVGKNSINQENFISADAQSG